LAFGRSPSRAKGDPAADLGRTLRAGRWRIAYGFATCRRGGAATAFGSQRRGLAGGLTDSLTAAVGANSPMQRRAACLRSCARGVAAPP